MATFKVGQRVRYVSQHCSRGHKWNLGPPVGTEGVIVREAPRSTGWEWVIDTPAFRDCEPGNFGLSPTEWAADSCMLAPLTDPKADEFIESIKRLKPYDEPKVAPRVDEGSPVWER